MAYFSVVHFASLSCGEPVFTQWLSRCHFNHGKYYCHTCGWCRLCCLRDLAARGSDVQPWQMVYGHLSALKLDAARVGQLLQASTAPAPGSSTAAAVDSTAPLLAPVASDDSRAAVTSAAAATCWFHPVAGYDALTTSSNVGPLAGAEGRWRHRRV